jgi:hypothetical protein
MSNKIIFIVTGADNIAGITPILRRERYIEYMLCLHKIFNYGFPVYGVLSEYEKHDDSPPFERFPFEKILYIKSGEIDSLNKSYSEIASIRRLIEAIGDSEIDDNTLIVKISGRYLLLDDSFINTIISNTQMNAFVKHNSINHMFTFVYALRYRDFKGYYTSKLHPNISTEYSIYSYLVENKIIDTTLNIERLGILNNVCNGNSFQVI